MRWPVPAMLALALLVPPMALAQIDDTGSTLGVVTSSFSPHSTKTDDGHTVVTGELHNRLDHPVTAVSIWAGFYDDVHESPLEAVIGASLLEVIPAGGSSPYVITSASPNSEITNISVVVQGFTSTSPKHESLILGDDALDLGDTLEYSGSVTNTGGTAAANLKVHVSIYDSFDPPRVLHIRTFTIDEPLGPDGSAEFAIKAPYTGQEVRIRAVAESENLLSNSLDVNIPRPGYVDAKVSINDVGVYDKLGSRIFNIAPGEKVSIEGNVWIQYLTGEAPQDQDYTYYVQVKQSGRSAIIEHVGHYEGRFEGAGSQAPAVTWEPKERGIYFIETYVWDADGIPLASTGPIVLVTVS